MKKLIFLILPLFFVSQVVLAETNICFDMDKVSGDSLQLKLVNVAKTVQNNSEIKGKNCVFSGMVIPDQLSVIAYKNKSGDCQPEVRSCNSGVLSGSSNYTKCEKTATVKKSAPKSEPTTR